MSFVELTCLPKDLPEFIDVDESGMTALDTLRVADLKLPENVTAVNPELPVATVTVISDDSAAPAAAAAAEAAPAAAEAAPAESK